MLRYTTDRVRPGLVTFYDIQSGNGAGLFLQPGACTGRPTQNMRQVPHSSTESSHRSRACAV